jgi:hypothetical protein
MRLKYRRALLAKLRVARERKRVAAGKCAIKPRTVARSDEFVGQLIQKNAPTGRLGDLSSVS